MTNSFFESIRFLRIERQLGEFFLIIGALLVFKGLEPYLDTLQLNDLWWILAGFIVVGLAVNRLMSYERKLKKLEG
jgi:hypothetical protein